MLMSFLLLPIFNLPYSCLVIQTDELNVVTLFFQDEINVGTGHVKFTDLVIIKYLLLFGCPSS